MKPRKKEICIDIDTQSPMQTSAHIYQLYCKSSVGKKGVSSLNDAAKMHTQQVREKKMKLTELYKLYPQAYNTHRGMKNRCKNEGIGLAPEFVKFVDFLDIMGPPPQPRTHVRSG